MVIADIQAILAKVNNKVSSTITGIQAEVFKSSYGELGKKIFEYSKRVLKLEGIIEDEEKPELTATDLMLAKSIAGDVKGGGWEGRGQQIMKMFSIIIGRNLESKAVGMTCRIDLPKGTIIKTKGTVGMISENGNLMEIKGNGLNKVNSYNKMNTDIEMATEDEIITFIGQILSSPVITRDFASKFKVSTAEEVMAMFEVSMNGIDNEEADQWEYRKFMVELNPDVTRGVA